MYVIWPTSWYSVLYCNIKNFLLSPSSINNPCLRFHGQSWINCSFVLDAAKTDTQYQTRSEDMLSFKGYFELYLFVSTPYFTSSPKIALTFYILFHFLQNLEDQISMMLKTMRYSVSYKNGLFILMLFSFCI